MIIASSFGFVSLIVVIAAMLAWALWRLARWAANRRQWLVIAVFAGVVAIITFVVLGEVNGLLRAMHPLSRPGRGILEVSGSAERARATVDAWQTWLNDPYTNQAARFLTPKVVALWHLGLDTVALIPAYVLFLGLLLHRSRDRLKALAEQPAVEPVGIEEASSAAFRDVLRRFALTATAAVWAFTLLTFFDLLENGLLYGFIDQRIDACPTGTGCEAVAVPSGAYAALLQFATYGKLAAFFGAIVLALAPAAAWGRIGTDWLRSLRPALHRLRGQFLVLVAFGVLMWFNPQTADVFRGWDPARTFLAIAAAFLAGLATWDAGRRVTHAVRKSGARDETSRPKELFEVRADMAAWGLVFLAVAFASIWFGLAPRGLAIPGAFLLLLAWFDRAGEAVDLPRPADVDRGKDTIPAGLAAAWPILLSLFVAKSLFPLTMYDHTHSFVFTAAVFLLWTFVIPALGIGGLYYGLLALVSKPAGEPSSVVKAAMSRAVRFGAQTETSARPTLAYFLILLGGLLWWRVMVNPWAVGEVLGAVTLVIAFFGVAAAAVGLASTFVEQTEPPGLFKVLRMQRIPIFLLVVIWLVLTAMIPRIARDDYHDVRTIDSNVDSTLTQLSSAGVFSRWLANQPVPPLLATAPSEPRPVIPMVLVATEGGGIKAATWTTLVLDCLFSEQPIPPPPGEPVPGPCQGHGRSRLGSVIVASGVSGGSVGLVTYVRHAADPALTASSGDWIDRVLGADFVSPSIAWQLYVEAPRAWLQFDNGMDRAEVLERGWEQTWPDGLTFGFGDLFAGAPESGGPLADGFRAFWAEHADVPLLLLNGSSVQDGCKFVTTPIDGNGTESSSWNCLTPHDGITVAPDPRTGRPGFLSGSRVLTDILCEDADDLRLSTAALMSARFPYVSPSGRLESCEAPRRAINVVDGGYGENTGSGSVLEFWSSISPLINQFNSDPANGACIVPALLQIQSGYGPTPDIPSTGQNELRVPAKTIVKTPTGITVWQRNAAQLALLDPLPFTGSLRVPARQGFYSLVYPYAHPGAEAPLGWSLSDEARIDLRHQLAAAGNQQALLRIGEFLDGPGTCAPIGEAVAFPAGA